MSTSILLYILIAVFCFLFGLIIGRIIGRIICFIVTLILRLVLHIQIFINKKQISQLNKKYAKLKREHAVLVYELALSSYQTMLEARNKYYNAHFITDEEEKTKVMDYWQKVYNSSISILEYSENADIKQYLEPHETKCLEETLLLPRYKLT